MIEIRCEPKMIRGLALVGSPCGYLLDETFASYWSFINMYAACGYNNYDTMVLAKIANM